MVGDRGFLIGRGLIDRQDTRFETLMAGTGLPDNTDEISAELDKSQRTEVFVRHVQEYKFVPNSSLLLIRLKRIARLKESRLQVNQNFRLFGKRQEQ